MKKSFHINGSLWRMIIVVMLVNTRIVSGQTGKEQSSPIPENINMILQASCVNCHGSNGKILPMTKLNISKWAEYSPAEKAEKAYSICSVLTDESMPPKSVRKSKPELIPAKEQIELVCKWAESLKPKTAGK